MESVQSKKKAEKRKRERETDEFDQILNKYASKKIQKEESWMWKLKLIW